MYKGYSLNLEKDYYKDYFHVSDLEIELYEMQMDNLKRNLQTKLNEKTNLSNNADDNLGSPQNSVCERFRTQSFSFFMRKNIKKKAHFELSPFII